MNLSESKRALASAVKAAQAAGAVMRRNLHSKKIINETSVHDIKLELDVRCQKLIERQLHAAFPHISFLGEEGDSGDRQAEYRWVVDPIDGTVNFTYGIPHACVSIALQKRVPSFGFHVSSSGKRAGKHSLPQPETQNPKHETILGVVYDPFQDELWTAIRGQPARLNGKVIRVSSRRTLGDAVVSIGFSKSRASVEHALPYFAWLTRRVRKIRMMGAAALGLTYVATGRFDAYIERGINLWDIAAGGLIVECAGGEFWHEPISGGKFRMIASNGLLGRTLRTGKFK
jgi:myo-inositol-1(or 4)-monophosphatase